MPGLKPSLKFKEVLVFPALLHPPDPTRLALGGCFCYTVWYLSLVRLLLKFFFIYFRYFLAKHFEFCRKDIMSKKSLPQLDATKERSDAPHVVILGAGASLAAFPNGDKNGRKLPLMYNIVEVIGMQDVLDRNGVEYEGDNFEEFYSNLVLQNANNKILNEIERSIYDYFSAMELPDEPTLYDYLVLSLRDKDIIATFNWDPFLALAFKRNRHLTNKMPKIAFLHGNVAVGCCLEHKCEGFLNDVECDQCGKPLNPTQLLYPVEQKNYQADGFIENEWKNLRHHIKNAYMITVLGYSAPTTDVEAKELLLSAWNDNSTTGFGVFHVIDIKEKSEVEENWKAFKAWSCSVGRDLRVSSLFYHPRRSCDAFAMATLQGKPWEDNPFPQFNTLSELQKWIKPLIDEENEDGKFSSKGKS